MPNEHRCVQCHKKFPHASTLQRHMETHMITGSWMCGLCNTLCNRFSGLNDHWKNSCPEFKMVFCDEEIKKMSCDDIREAAFRLTLDEFASEIDLNEPGPSTKPFPDRTSKTSLCIYCYLFVPRGTLNHHLGVHTKRCGPEEVCTGSVVRYVCDLCGYGFRYKKSLFVHWRQRCQEIASNCPSQGMIMDNQQLKKMVEKLVKRAEIVKPFEMLINRGEEEKEYENGGELEEQDEDEETKPAYTAPIIPIRTCDRLEWNIKNIKLECPLCSQCGREFHSTGRLKQHENSFHGIKKYVHCELCQAKFSLQRVLNAHLRGTCKAMKIEEPDERRRRDMTKEELQQLVDGAKLRWKSLFEIKKAENIRFITEFLNGIDKKNGTSTQKVEDNVILDVPMRNAGYIRETISDIHFCEFCKVKFNSARFLYQHHLLAHTNQQPQPQKLTITTSSLLPYVKLPEATFYDSSGKEYQIGKFLEKGKEHAKHLRSRVIKPGTTVPKIEENDHFVVRLYGDEDQYVLLNQHELPEVCSKAGTLIALFSSNPMLLDDCPVLSREV